MYLRYYGFIVALSMALAVNAGASEPVHYFMPYAGYHFFGGDAESTVEMGARVGMGVTSNFGVEVGLDYIPAITHGTGSSRTDIVRYSLDMRYEFQKLLIKAFPQLQSFGLLGLSDDLSNFGHGFDFHYGAGVRYPISDVSLVEVSLVIGDDMALRVGIRKPLIHKVVMLFTPDESPRLTLADSMYPLLMPWSF